MCRVSARLAGRQLGVIVRNGAEACEVAATLELTAQTVYNWSHGWRERGMCGLLIGKGGRPRALPEAMLATAVSAARMESLTLAQIAQRSGSWRATAVPCGDLGRGAQARRLLLQAQSLLAQKNGQQKRPNRKLQKRCCFIWNLSGIISIFVEQFRTPDPTLCGGFAAQPWPPTDHGGSAHGWRDLFALHDGVRSPQAQDGTTAAMPPTPSSAKPLRSH